ncbi:MAG: hypothetical protein AAGK23_03455 [Pseudomonadota bacterium]
MIEAVIGLVGVVVGSVITLSKDSWALWRERRRDGSYSAIRLICLLEDYANKCIDVAGDDGTAYGRPAGRMESGEEVQEAQVATPEPPDYPTDIAWRSLDESLMHRILALPNRARSTDRYISACAEHAFPPDYSEVFEPRMEGYARLGLDTLDIVRELRRRYGVAVESRTDLGMDWDPKAHLEGLLEGFQKRDAEREERRKEREIKAAAAKEVAE